MLFGHQGDVFLKQLTNEVLNFDTSKLTKISLDNFDKLTIVEGELTGHHHVIENPDAVELYKYDSGITGLDRFVLKVVEPTKLVHMDVRTGELTKEHNTIDLGVGVYKFGNQIQPSDDEQTFMRVAD